MTIKKEDIIKTVIILWFVATTGYVIFDQYQAFKIGAMQNSYKTGYTDSIMQLMKQTKESGCNPFEVRKEDAKIQLVDGACLNNTAMQPEPAVKK